MSTSGPLSLLICLDVDADFLAVRRIANSAASCKAEAFACLRRVEVVHLSTGEALRAGVTLCAAPPLKRRLFAIRLPDISPGITSNAYSLGRTVQPRSSRSDDFDKPLLDSCKITRLGELKRAEKSKTCVTFGGTASAASSNGLMLGLKKVGAVEERISALHHTRIAGHTLMQGLPVYAGKESASPQIA